MKRSELLHANYHANKIRDHFSSEISNRHSRREKWRVRWFSRWSLDGRKMRAILEGTSPVENRERKFRRRSGQVAG